MTINATFYIDMIILHLWRLIQNSHNAFKLQHTQYYGFEIISFQDIHGSKIFVYPGKTHNFSAKMTEMIYQLLLVTERKKERYKEQ